MTRIIHMRTLHLGPEELLVAAKIAVRAEESAAEVADAINDAEKRIREAVPIARVIYLEPDIYDEAAAAAGENPAKVPGGPASPDGITPGGDASGTDASDVDASGSGTTHGSSSPGGAPKESGH